MIHPSTEVRKVSDQVGYGVYATAFIPAGTIVYVQDPYELVISEAEYNALPEIMKGPADIYSYIDQEGNRIISWDLAKYVNHCCNPNTISTGYGFEIAIRDIYPGDEITDEYAIFNLDKPMELVCAGRGCRRTLNPEDFDSLYPVWDAQIREALDRSLSLTQPLWTLLSQEALDGLAAYYGDSDNYISVYSLRHKPKIPQPRI